MRTCWLLAFAALAGCGDLTNGPGRCVESTPDWWPLDDAIWWRYEEYDLQDSTRMYKDLWVQAEDSRIGGLLGDERGARTWRADWIDVDGSNTVVESGWRWFVDTGTTLAFQRDVWTTPVRVDAPCATLGPDDDPGTCDEATPILDVYYFPWRTRLDYEETKVCERSSWSVRFVERTIVIGEPNPEYPQVEPCPLATWRANPAECDYLDEEEEEQWDVQYLDRTINVPAGPFEDSLCVRRIGENDKTYCFAKDIGKVFELDRTRLLECLATYQLPPDATGPPDGWDYPCQIDQVEDVDGTADAD